MLETSSSGETLWVVWQWVILEMTAPGVLLYIPQRLANEAIFSTESFPWESRLEQKTWC